jgi:hypothetical protein
MAVVHIWHLSLQGLVTSVCCTLLRVSIVLYAKAVMGQRKHDGIVDT